MDLGDVLVAIAIGIGVMTLLGVALVGFLMWRYRIPPRGLVALGAAFVYLISPIDLIPEAVFGPIGLIDDAGVIALVTVWVIKISTVRRMIKDSGIKGRRPKKQERQEASPS